MIQGIILTNGLIILSEIMEIMADLGEPNCKLLNPVVVDKIITQETILKRYLIEYTNDTEFMISSDKIFTIFDPTDKLKEKYFAFMGKDDTVMEQLTSSEQLNEGES
jgi:hypothetical protein